MNKLLAPAQLCPRCRRHYLRFVACTHCFGSGRRPLHGVCLHCTGTGGKQECPLCDVGPGFVLTIGSVR